MKVNNRYLSLADRIFHNVRMQDAPEWCGLDTPCWIWIGPKNARGYGRIQIRMPERKKPYSFGVLVHRLVLFVFCGIPLREVEYAMHKCGVKECCNPKHIDAGTALENRDFYYNVERFAKLAAAAPPPAASTGEDWYL